MPTLVGTSDYYHRIIDMSNGANYGTGTYFYFYWMLKTGQLLTLFIGIFGLVKVFEEHDTPIHGSEDKSDGVLRLLTFVIVNYYAINDVSIHFPVNDEGCMELSQHVFPSGEMPRYQDKIRILSGPTIAISDGNFLYLTDPLKAEGAHFKKPK